MKYYVYILYDPRFDNQPFYIGKGSGNRAQSHLTETEITTQNRRKFRKISKIRAAGLEPIIHYYSTDLTEDEAYALEASLILKYGRAKMDEGGILTNICLDNRPPSGAGRPVSEETKRKIGDAQLGELNHRYGKEWSEEEKQRRSVWAKGLDIRPPIQTGPMSQEKKDAIGRGNKGKRRTPEQSAYLSSIRKGKSRGPHSDETRERIRVSSIIAKSKSTGVEITIYPADLTGHQFGSWTVLFKAERRANNAQGTKAIYWHCQCSCSKQRDVLQYKLLKAKSLSCGCKRRTL